MFVLFLLARLLPFDLVLSALLTRHPGDALALRGTRFCSFSCVIFLLSALLYLLLESDKLLARMAKLREVFVTPYGSDARFYWR